MKLWIHTQTIHNVGHLKKNNSKMNKLCDYYDIQYLQIKLKIVIYQEKFRNHNGG